MGYNGQANKGQTTFSKKLTRGEQGTNIQKKFQSNKNIADSLFLLSIYQCEKGQ